MYDYIGRSGLLFLMSARTADKRRKNDYLLFRVCLIYSTTPNRGIRVFDEDALKIKIKKDVLNLSNVKHLMKKDEMILPEKFNVCPLEGVHAVDVES